MPVVLVVLAAICFGTTGTALAFAPESTSPASAGAVRILLGGLLLVAIVTARRSWRRGAPSAARRPRTLPTAALVVLGAAAIVAYQPAFFLGTTRAGVAVGTIVALGSAPVFTGALEWIVTRRAPGRVWIVATLLASGGVALLGGITGGTAAPVDPTGIVSALAAGASYAVYALVAKLLIARGAESLWVMGTLFGAAAAVSVPLAAATDTSWLATPDGALVALWLGAVTTALAYVLFGRGLTRLRASTAATLTLAEPLTAALLGVALLRESLEAAAVTGIVAIAAAIVVLILPWGRPRSHRPQAGAPTSTGP